MHHPGFLAILHNSVVVRSAWRHPDLMKDKFLQILYRNRPS